MTVTDWRETTDDGEKKGPKCDSTHRSHVSCAATDHLWKKKLVFNLIIIFLFIMWFWWVHRVNTEFCSAHVSRRENEMKCGTTDGASFRQTLTLGTPVNF